MPVYTCNNFRGHYPVGVGAVVVAINKIQAAKQLSTALQLQGLDQVVGPKQMIELPQVVPTVRILTDGSY